MAVLGSHPGEFFPSTVLARTVNTNPVVIRRLLLDLHQARLVKTERGPAGGACLKGKPNAITLADIYRAVEKPDLFGKHPSKPSKRCPVGCRIEPALRRVFSRASKAMERELEGITLQSFLRTL
jgi:Rrf2 family protein